MRGKLPAIGEIRIVKKFAFFPITSNRGEWAWLETVYIRQMFVNIFGWINTYFVDEDEYEMSNNLELSE